MGCVEATMHTTYKPQSIALFSALLLLPLGCDEGDLGKDSAGDSAASDDDSNGSETAETAETAESGGNDSGDACSDKDCGPPPAAPELLCDDGVSTVGFVCVDSGDGCGWTMEECPAPCTEEECGPAPGAPVEVCPDGVNVSGPGPCERNADGVCGHTWTECPACCSVIEMPECVDPTCCGDGIWVCGDASECPEEATALACDDAPMCQDEGESCAAGESCCDGLQCCAGVPVPEGEEFCGAVCPISDRNKKENFAPVDADAILAKVGALEISTWNYTFQDPQFRHLGPMAQDFKAAFDIGHTDKAIFQVDADGVALASIQALYGQVKLLESENSKLRKTLSTLEKRLDKLEKR